jgi:hypothetical protein
MADCAHGAVLRSAGHRIDGGGFGNDDPAPDLPHRKREGPACAQFLVVRDRRPLALTYGARLAATPRDASAIAPFQSSNARRCGTIPSGKALVTKTKGNAFMAQNPNAPTPGRAPLHDPPEPPAHDPPTEPLHDPPGDPTYEPPQPGTDPTPNPASDPPRELPRGIAWR